MGHSLENPILVETRQIEGADRPILGFETLTLAPIERALVEPVLLTAEERD